VDPDALLATWLWEADTLFRELDEQKVEGTPPLAAEVMARLTHMGESVRVKSGDGIVEGICTGLSPRGFLELDGGRMVTSGELVPPASEGGH
jgi:biotin-(acetyl-CoA carboxylase) ligase